MSHSMHNKFTILNKSFTTRFTLISFVTRVNTIMPLQVAFLGEVFITDITLVWLFPCVCAPVCCKMSTLAEGFVAYITLKTSVTCVDTIMYPQILFVLVLFIANIAFVRQHDSFPVV